MKLQSTTTTTSNSEADAETRYLRKVVILTMVIAFTAVLYGLIKGGLFS
jgi:predicted Co/Zn/Cd cation transporter (cation efflux family)